MKAFNDVVDLIVSQGSFRDWSGDTRWVAAPRRSTIRVLGRLGLQTQPEGRVGAAEERSVNGHVSGQVNRGEGAVKIRTTGPSSGGPHCLNSALCVGLSDEWDETTGFAWRNFDLGRRVH